MIWKEKYKLGIPAIDEQHKELFRRVLAFIETVRSPLACEQKIQMVTETLNFMKQYIVEHFRAEEEYQRLIGYPDMVEHAKLHAQMVKFVIEVEAQYLQQGYNDQLIQQFSGKLLAWLINHVAAQDQMIADYANMRGAAHND